MTFHPDMKRGPHLASAVGRLHRLSRKELNECLRDRRTIVTLVLMPILLYPLLAIAFQQVFLGPTGPAKPNEYRLGLTSQADADPFRQLLSAGEQAIRGRAGAFTPDGDKGMEPPHFSPWPKFNLLEAPDLEAAVRDNLIDVGIRRVADPGKPGGNGPREPFGLTFELIYREDSPEARACVRFLETLLAEANILAQRAQMESLLAEANALARRTRQPPLRLRLNPIPVGVQVKAVPNPDPREASLLPSLVPLVLVLMTITGAVYPSIDLTAGERERGTLEVLVAAPIPRLGVLFAKYIAVLTVAMLTAVVNLTAMAITLYATGIGPQLFGTGMTPLVFVQVLALLLLFAAFFSAVLLAITSFARSFKEAQAYLIPLMLLALTPGILALLPGLSLQGPLAVVPLLNIVLLARDIFDGAASLAPSLVVVLSTLLYAAAAIGLAARIFGTDAVLSSDQTGWGDVFRRPSQPRDVPTQAGALLCLALMFPAYFLLTAGLAQVPGLSMADKLNLSAAASVLLFVGLPLLAAWAGHVRVLSAFRLRAPAQTTGPFRVAAGHSGWAVVSQASAAAVLLGVGLWPFTHELVLLLRQLGFTTLGPEVLNRLPEVIASWRTYPPALIVLAVAVVPAVTEELFFRGFLFGALLGGGEGEDRREQHRSPARAILVSAGLFSLFHLLVAGVPAVERLPSSFLFGILLAWMCWLSGNVLPGILLHVLHNSLLVLLAYYEPFLTQQGWIPSAEDHLPGAVLGVCGLCTILGLVWLFWLMGRATATGEPPE